VAKVTDEITILIVQVTDEITILIVQVNGLIVRKFKVLCKIKFLKTV